MFHKIFLFKSYSFMILSREVKSSKEEELEGEDHRNRKDTIIIAKFRGVEIIAVESGAAMSALMGVDARSVVGWIVAKSTVVEIIAVGSGAAMSAVMGVDARSAVGWIVTEFAMEETAEGGGHAPLQVNSPEGGKDELYMKWGACQPSP